MVKNCKTYTTVKPYQGQQKSQQKTSQQAQVEHPQNTSQLGAETEKYHLLKMHLTERQYFAFHIKG